MAKNLTYANDLLRYFFTDAVPSYIQLLSSSNWTLNGWTGSFGAGFAAPGSTNALTNSLAAVSGQQYSINIIIVGQTAGTATLTFGAQTSTAYAASGAYAWLPTASSTATLSVTPTASFNGTVVFQNFGYYNYYVALHTADPTTSGNQSSSEVTTGAYPGYARVAVPSTSAGFTVTSNAVQNTALVSFPVCLAGGSSPVITYWSVGVLNAGAGEILYSGSVASSLTVTTGLQPQFAAGTLTATEA